MYVPTVLKSMFISYFSWVLGRNDAVRCIGLGYPLLHDFLEASFVLRTTIERGRFDGGKGAFRHSTILLRPQTLKPNPAHTPSGKFDRSFEKLSGEIENRMPFRQQQILFGSKYDRNFGEESYEELKQAAQDDLFGREPERAAARQARSYFTGDDLSPTSMHVKSPRLKVAQLQHRQKYDKGILKTSKESCEYYYRRETPSERRKRYSIICAMITVTCLFSCIFLVYSFSD
ncbi:hypothetical protein TRVL_06173 [Trypanosoma vivax]|uniref:Uncharacterized protein n=1 Tax=Trypanosoma vivax (strain Y486) TaxID=1055687 RepID=G0TV50_TRYVY|nr:hypothetical protein TRVL_06173 [Trypanosoma vivax]CCC47816.1 conserved hypothetical protein [Trypanosoma vivax Y486]